MKRKLRHYEFVPHAPSSTGVERVNHTSDYCVGDSKSMIVERKENGDISAHCFRCGGDGFYSTIPYYQDSDTKRRRFKGENVGTGNLVVGGLLLPDDAREDRFPSPVYDWISKSGVTKEIIEHEQFLWSDEESTLYIPVRQLNDLKGYAIKHFFSDLRYTNQTLDKPSFFGYYRKELDKPSTSVVIVEDVLSGLRCKEISDTLVCLGTSLKDSAVWLMMQQGYKKAFVFLDADNPTVKQEARRIKKKLSFLQVKIVETGKDPKYHSKQELEKLLWLR